jgi:hypothetical protein
MLPYLSIDLNDCDGNVRLSQPNRFFEFKICTLSLLSYPRFATQNPYDSTRNINQH